MLVAQVLGQLTLHAALHQPARQVPQQALGSEDLRLAAPAGEQLVDQPVGELLAQLLRQLTDRQPGPDTVKRLVKQLLAQLAPAPAGTRRGRRRLN